MTLLVLDSATDRVLHSQVGWGGEGGREGSREGRVFSQVSVGQVSVGLKPLCLLLYCPPPSQVYLPPLPSSPPVFASLSPPSGVSASSPLPSPPPPGADGGQWAGAPALLRGGPGRHTAPPPLVQVQMGASGPVRLLFSEDLAVVEFWDTLAKR